MITRRELARIESTIRAYIMEHENESHMVTTVGPGGGYVRYPRYSTVRDNNTTNDKIRLLMDYLGLEIQDLPAARKVVKKEKKQ